MESVKSQFFHLIKQYKLAACILAVGMLLMLLPEKREESNGSEQYVPQA